MTALAARAARLALPLLAALVSLIAADARAFDGERKGFVLGLGAGGSSATIEDQDGHSVANVANGGFFTDFEIGKGANHDLSIYYANRVAWLGDGTRFSLTGVGVRHFLPRGGKFFADATLGLSGWSGRLGDTIGLGASLAVGWEPVRHWLVRGSLLYGDSALRTAHLEPRGTAGTLSVIWLGY